MFVHDPDLIGLVQAHSLIPAEVPTPLKLLRQADCYQQYGVKYPQRGTFHSYAELLHFALCEGDPAVASFTPQPFRVRLQGRPYVPDAHLVLHGERVVRELKPRGELDDKIRRPLEVFFRFHQMRYEVISNESILEREIEALNWLHVVRALCSATDVRTDAEERDLLGFFLTEEAGELGDLLDPSNRRANYTLEIAVYRLLHRGHLRARWQDARFGPRTVIERCA